MDLLLAARKFGTILGEFLDSRRLLVDFGTILCTLLSMDLLVPARKLGTILGDFFDSRRLLIDFGIILCTLLSMDLLVIARKLTTFQKCCWDLYRPPKAKATKYSEHSELLDPERVESQTTAELLRVQITLTLWERAAGSLPNTSQVSLPILFKLARDHRPMFAAHCF